MPQTKRAALQITWLQVLESATPLNHPNSSSAMADLSWIHQALAELTALSQKGFVRQPRELLALAQWSDPVRGFLVSCDPFR